MIAKIFECVVSEFYLPYFINGELDGYEEKELEDLDNFCAMMSDQHGSGYFTFSYDEDSSPEFSYCEVSGLRSMVVPVQYVTGE